MKLNQYITLHEKYISLLVDYHNAYTAWVKSQSLDKTIVLRRIIKEMRKTQHAMWFTANEAMKESKQRKRQKWNREQKEQ